MVVYRIIHIPDNRIVYVGYTKVSIEKRFSQHKTSSRNEGYELHSFMNEKGVENFKIEMICKCLSFSKLRKAEKFFIKKYDTYNNGLNMNKGGGGSEIVSEKSRKKMSQSAIGRKASDLAKSRMSEFQSKKKVSDKTKKIMSEKMKGNKNAFGNTVMLGRKLSDDVKNKISKSMKAFKMKQRLLKG